MFDITQSISKEHAIKNIKSELQKLRFNIIEKDTTKPWGAYFRINEQDASTFVSHFFKEFAFPSWVTGGMRLDPKILLVAPSKRLSWQYHDRRGEVWKILKGPVSVMTSQTDEMSQPQIHVEGEIIEISCGTRHRLIGMDDWGIVAEIWVSTDKDNPSDESDNHRLQDDFGRN